MKMFSLGFLVLVVSLTFAEKEISFNEDIRPLFSNSCFHCHGPDEETQEAGLRLDTFAGAIADNDGVKGIVPGDPTLSEAFLRLISEDPDLVMPPPKHGDPFTPEQVETVKKWIEQGAPYEQHWAYQKPVPQQIPSVDTAPVEWQKNPVDAFIMERLQQNNLSPSAPADKNTLARRAALDLTGLPPTPGEVEAFLKDSSPEAYGTYIDHLLSKPAYGEHWARMWLDLARYADSAGYADDPPRVIWAYRDYVIRAFNENMPYDQFTREQLAGDLLPNSTENQRIATAFHRNTQTNNEGGTNDEEFRNVAVVDRVNTTMATWMGTTMSCAQCHTHKYDPITHEEYFQVFDILNQTEDADRKDEAPFISLFAGEQLQKKSALEAKVQALEQRVREIKVVPAEFVKWEEELKAHKTQWTPIIPQGLRAESGTTLSVLADSSILASGHHPETENYHVSAEIDPAKTPHITGVKIELLPDPALPSMGPGRNGNGNLVLNHLNLSSTGNLTPRTPAKYVRLQALGKQRFIHIAEFQAFANGENVALTGTARQDSVSHGGDAARAIDGNTDGNFTKNSVTHTKPADNSFWELALNTEEYLDKLVLWNRTDSGLQKRLTNYQLSVLDKDRNVIWTETYKEHPNPRQEVILDKVQYAQYDVEAVSADYEQKNFPARNIIDAKHSPDSGWAVAGQPGKRHEAILPLLQPLPTGQLRFFLKQSYHKHSIGKFRLSVTSDPRPQAVLSESILALLNTPSEQRTPSQTQALEAYYLRSSPAFAADRKELANAKAALKNITPNTTLPVLAEVDAEKRRTTHIHLRGSYLSHGPKVSAGFPKEFSPEGFSAEKEFPDRLDLANWILHENNPLATRVAVNRFWEKMFGIGLVATSEEFGSQGEPPSHPELLDWLALEFYESGWDVKKLLKLIATSAAYSQNSHVTAEMHADDPENRLLARGPRVRLSAEQVRDQALKASGLLSEKMYGAPVNPPQPDMGLKAAFGGNLDWVNSTGEDKFRRGLYTSWRRSNPYPSMATFDAPNREVCVVRRDRTNTPLQALVTLNDPVYVEAAQALARRISDGAVSVEDSVQKAFQYTLSRPSTEMETQRLTALYNDALSEYSVDLKAAEELATIPIGPAPESANLPHLASLTLVSNVILNLDEALMKR